MARPSLLAAAALAAASLPAARARHMERHTDPHTVQVPRTALGGRFPTLLPKWEPTYNMQSSTIVQPCNSSGMTDPHWAAQWGIVDFDWSNGKAIWANQHPMDAESLLITQAAMVKAVNPRTKVFVYRNLVKALPWYPSVSGKASDPAYSSWFLPFKAGGAFPNGSYHVPQCDDNYDPPLCTPLYHDQEQTPEHPHGDGSCLNGPCDCGGVPCGEYLWDHRNASMAAWLQMVHVLNNVTGLNNANVSGAYFDDGWSNTTQPIASWMPQPYGFCDTYSPIGGPSEEVYTCAEDMGLTQQDTTDIKTAWENTITSVFEAVVDAGRFGWQMFTFVNTPAKGNASVCAAWFRNACAPGSQVYSSAIMHEFTEPKTFPLTAFTQDLATFLLVRGPYAWLGYGWVGCNIDYEFRPELTVDYGVPESGQCVETATGSGVFTREWTKASVSFDCNAWEGSITMKQ